MPFKLEVGCFLKFDVLPKPLWVSRIIRITLCIAYSWQGFRKRYAWYISHAWKQAPCLHIYHCVLNLTLSKVSACGGLISKQTLISHTWNMLVVIRVNVESIKTCLKGHSDICVCALAMRGIRSLDHGKVYSRYSQILKFLTRFMLSVKMMQVHILQHTFKDLMTLSSKVHQYFKGFLKILKFVERVWSAQWHTSSTLTQPRQIFLRNISHVTSWFSQDLESLAGSRDV